MKIFHGFGIVDYEVAILFHCDSFMDQQGRETINFKKFSSIVEKLAPKGGAAPGLKKQKTKFGSKDRFE